MIHSSLSSIFTLALVLGLAVEVGAQQPPRKSAYDLIPDSSQAIVWIRDGESLAQQWERTPLYDLVHDPAASPFFEAQHLESE